MTAANALVSDVGEAHRGTALNLVNLFFGLGGLTTPFIAANLFGRNWVRLCYTVASLTVVTLMIEMFTKMPAPAGAAASFSRMRSGARAPAGLSIRGFPLSLYRL